MLIKNKILSESKEQFLGKKISLKKKKKNYFFSVLAIYIPVRKNSHLDSIHSFDLYKLNPSSTNFAKVDCFSKFQCFLPTDRQFLLTIFFSLALERPSKSTGRQFSFS